MTTAQRFAVLLQSSVLPSSVKVIVIAIAICLGFLRWRNRRSQACLSPELHLHSIGSSSRSNGGFNKGGSGSLHVIPICVACTIGALLALVLCEFHGAEGAVARSIPLLIQARGQNLSLGLKGHE
jgi:hypothetical protein